MVTKDQSGLSLIVDGIEVEISGPQATLLDVLRDDLGIVEVKDGCSPQGQCGCCTVLVDGQPRVACVTPARRVAGRTITTLAGMEPDRRQAWSRAFTASGGSQCGFCTPGIIVRLDALDRKHAEPTEEHVEQALLAHLCRCTGWQTIIEAWNEFREDAKDSRAHTGGPLVGRDQAAANTRAALEGGVAQRVDPAVALGHGGFAADLAPADALVAVSDGQGGWAVADTASEARTMAAKVQGRRTPARHGWPLQVPPGEWAVTLRTTWVEPGYVETDASWCEPGGDPFSAAANGGAFGAKKPSFTEVVARRLADEHQRPVLVLGSREDATRWGPKRPPVAGGADPDGSGWLRVAATPGISEAIDEVAPGLRVEEVTVPGPPTSASIRAAGWAEAQILLAGARGEVGRLRAPNGAEAEAEIVDGTIRATVRCGPVLDEVVLRSYCIGAAHMAWSWVTSEALTTNEEGQIQDLTIRSFGIVRAGDTPPIEITLEHTSGGEARNGSDAVFAAVAAVCWLSFDCRQDWPVGVNTAEHRS